MKIMPTGLAAVALALTVAPAGAADLKRLDADHFSVMLPAAPERQSSEVAIPGGKVATQVWTVSDEGVLYSISTADYPQKVIDNAPAAKVLNEARDGLTNQLRGTISDEQELTLAGNPGRQFVIASDNGEVKARTYLVGPRLYTLLVLYNPSIAVPQRDTFLGSLKLKKLAR